MLLGGFTIATAAVFRIMALDSWETPTTLEDMANVFLGDLRGAVKRQPWCEGLPAQETGLILKRLLKCNQLRLLTIKAKEAAKPWPRTNG